MNPSKTAATMSGTVYNNSHRAYLKDEFRKFYGVSK
jgi:hypothetical protein